MLPVKTEAKHEGEAESRSSGGEHERDIDGPRWTKRAPGLTQAPKRYKSIPDTH